MHIRGALQHTARINSTSTSESAGCAIYEEHIMLITKQMKP